MTRAPMPPLDPKPVPTWSLLRRHSLIVPQNRSPIHYASAKVPEPESAGINKNLGNAKQIWYSDQTKSPEPQLLRIPMGSQQEPRIPWHILKSADTRSSNPPMKPSIPPTLLNLTRQSALSVHHNATLIHVPKDFSYIRSSIFSTNLSGHVASIDSFAFLRIPDNTTQTAVGFTSVRCQLVPRRELLAWRTSKPVGIGSPHDSSEPPPLLFLRPTQQVPITLPKLDIVHPQRSAFTTSMPASWFPPVPSLLQIDQDGHKYETKIPSLHRPVQSVHLKPKGISCQTQTAEVEEVVCCAQDATSDPKVEHSVTVATEAKREAIDQANKQGEMVVTEFRDAGVQLDFMEGKNVAVFENYTECTAPSLTAIPDDIRDAIELLLKYDDQHDDLKGFLSVGESRPHDRDGISSPEGNRPMNMKSFDLYEDVRRSCSKMDNRSPDGRRLEEAAETARMFSDAMTSPTKEHGGTEEQTPATIITIADPVTSMKLNEPIADVREPKSVADVWLQADAAPQVPFDVLQALNEIEHRLHTLDMQPLKRETHKNGRSVEVSGDFVPSDLDRFPLRNIKFDELALSSSLSRKPPTPSPRMTTGSALSEAGSKQRLSTAVRSGLPNGTTRRSRSEEKRPVHNVATNRTARSVTKSLSRKRDKEREERRALMVARRCEEAIEFANQVFSEVAMAKSQFGNSNKATSSRKVALTGGPSQFGAPTLTNRGARRPPRVKMSQQICRPKYSIIDAKSDTKGVSTTPRRGRGMDHCHRGGRGAGPQRHMISPTTSQALISDEEDQQTTILSDWSLDSQVKRILSQKEEGVFAGSLGISPPSSNLRGPGAHRVFTTNGWPLAHVESEQLTDDGNAVSATSFIDWNEIDQLLQNN